MKKFLSLFVALAMVFSLFAGVGTHTAKAATSDSVGVFRPSNNGFYLRTGTTVAAPIYLGDSLDKPIIGNWDGIGADEIGVFRPSNVAFFFRSSTGTVAAPIYLGDAGDLPIIGDWNGDGTDEIGVFRPSTNGFYLRSSTGTVSAPIYLGNIGDLPIIGDWSGDGMDEIGIFRPSNLGFYLRTGTTVAAPIVLGDSGDLPIIGDWNGDSTDEIGVFRPSNLGFYLRTGTTVAAPVYLGDTGDKPIIGIWPADVAIAAATAAVVVAEGSGTEADVNAAQTLVTALPPGTVKDALQARLSAVVLGSPTLTIYWENLNVSWAGYPANTVFETNVNLLGGFTLADFNSVVIRLYNGTTLLATNSAKPYLFSTYPGTAGVTDLFGIGDTQNLLDDPNWNIGAYPSSLAPTSATFTLTTIGGAVYTATATHTIGQYTATFKDWNGAVLGTSTVDFNTAATAPSNPTRTGYTFAGWDVSFTKVNTNMDVTATYTINQYTLTYTAGTNGTLTGTAPISPQTVNYLASGTTVTAVPNAGYHFVSWSDGILTAARTDTGVTANITVTATFAVGVYVTDEPTLLAALADTNITTIIFANSITLATKTADDYLTISRAVTIDGQGHALNKGILILASNVIVKNLTITPSEFDPGWYYGIMIADVQGVQILNCGIGSPVFVDAVGISDETGSLNTVFTVSGTTISNGWTGILIDSPNTHATLTGNSISYEKHAIYVRLGLSQQVITGNTISNPRVLGDLLTAGDGIEVPTGTTEPVMTALKSANTFVGVVPGNEVVALP